MKKIHLLIACLLVVVSGHIVAADSKEISIPTSIIVNTEKDISSEDLQQLIRNKIQYVNSNSININLNQQTKSIQASTLGIYIQPAKPINTYTSEKTFTLSTFLKTEIKTTIDLELFIDKEKLSNSISKYFPEVKQAKEPEFIFENGNFILIPGEEGYSIDAPSIATKLDTHFVETGQLLNYLEIPVQIIKPSISEVSAKDSLEKLNQFNQKQITLTYSDYNYQETFNIKKEHITTYANQLTLNQFGKDQIKEFILPIQKETQNITIKKLDLENNNLEVEGSLQDGIDINENQLFRDIEQRINLDLDTPIEIQTTITKAEIINQTGLELKFELLGQGKSNYKASSAARAHNVEFASDSRYKTHLIPQGEQFKFNSHLGGPITISRGWKNAFIIDGGEVVPGVGGGICQMSTTVYRAALNSGLQIDTHFNHSLYVSYYSDYGDGLDSTIFPGGKNLIFTNNTPGPVIMQSFYNDNDDLFVNMIGVSDGREVTMEGPFYRSDRYEDPYEMKLRANQIGWIRTIKDSNGNETQEQIISKFGKFYKR